MKAQMEPYKDNEFSLLDNIIDSVKNENILQLSKWGAQKRTIFEWLSYLGEEVGELNEACLDIEYNENDIYIMRTKAYGEAIQVATLALKIAEMMLNKNMQKENKNEQV